MFSGLVRAIGTVESAENRTDGSRLTLSTGNFEECASGDSLAVSGVCLTVIATSAGKAEFDVSSETLRRTTLGGLEKGDRVNLERPLKLYDLVHGHLVQGHVDFVAKVSDIRVEGETRRIMFTLPAEFAKYLVPKGSVTVDGVSLTVGEITEAGFSTYVIPATHQQTIAGSYKPGTPVNIEVDIIAKYLERLSSK